MTHCFDIFRDMNIEKEGHELKKLNFERKELVGVIKCKYDGKDYKITVEHVEHEHSTT